MIHTGPPLTFTRKDLLWYVHEAVRSAAAS